jgi:hypothetical protein
MHIPMPSTAIRQGAPCILTARVSLERDADGYDQLCLGEMMVSGRRSSKSVMYNFTPAPRSIQAQFERKPRVAIR